MNVAHLIYNKIQKRISIVSIIIIAFEVLYVDFIRARGENMWIITLIYVNTPKMKCEGELDCYSYTFNQVRTEHSQCIQSQQWAIISVAELNVFSGRVFKNCFMYLVWWILYVATGHCTEGVVKCGSFLLPCFIAAECLRGQIIFYPTLPSFLISLYFIFLSLLLI